MKICFECEEGDPIIDWVAALQLKYPHVRRAHLVRAGIEALIFDCSAERRAELLIKGGYQFELAPVKRGRAVRIRCICHSEVHNKEDVVARTHDTYTTYYCARGLATGADL